MRFGPSDSRGRGASEVWTGAGLLLVGVLAPAIAGVVACASPGAAVPGSSAADPMPVSLPAGPASPEGALPMPKLTLDWSPPVQAAGDVEALAGALDLHPRIGLLVDPRIVGGGSSTQADAFARLIGELAPKTAVHALPTRALGEVLRGDPPLAPQLGPEGRLGWRVDGALTIDAGASSGWAAQGDPVVLVVGPVEVEPNVWRDLTAVEVGTCAPLAAAIGSGQSRSQAMLKPFVDYADAALASLYRHELEEVVPRLTRELSEFSRPRERGQFASQSQWERFECGRTYREYLEPFAACVAESGEGGAQAAGGCASAPRLYLRGSARIANVEPTTYVPARCPSLLGLDVVGALRESARRAAERAGDLLDLEWLVLADRLATVSEVDEVLAQICTPGRRRFSAPDIDELRARVSAIGALLTREEAPVYDARLLFADGVFHVPELGPVRQLARFDPGTGSAGRSIIVSARELREFAQARARCQGRPGESPLLALLVTTETATVEYLGYFHAQELWCDELGPLR